jgi:ribosomal protein L34
MDQQYLQTLRVFEQLHPGDMVRLRHEIKVGFRSWQATTEGKVVHVERRRHGLHYQRNFDDKAFSDVLVLQRPDGELTTVTLDEFSVLEKISPPITEDLPS